mgnify:CR=1 FL=1
MSTLSFEIHVEQDHAGAITRVTEELKKEGFGVLSRIDVHQAFKEKIGVDFRPYTILGACNPQLAHRALSEQPEVGVLLPCNVTVEADPKGGSLVRVIDPEQMLNVGDLGADATLREVGAEAERRLKRVVKALGG